MAVRNRTGAYWLLWFRSSQGDLDQCISIETQMTQDKTGMNRNSCIDDEEMKMKKKFNSEEFKSTMILGEHFGVIRF